MYPIFFCCFCGNLKDFARLNKKYLFHCLKNNLPINKDELEYIYNNFCSDECEKNKNKIYCGFTGKMLLNTQNDSNNFDNFKISYCMYCGEKKHEDCAEICYFCNKIILYTLLLNDTEKIFKYVNTPDRKFCWRTGKKLKNPWKFNGILVKNYNKIHEIKKRKYESKELYLREKLIKLIKNN